MTLLRDISTMYTSMFSLVFLLILFESRLDNRKTLTVSTLFAVPLLLLNFILLLVLGPAKMSSLVLLTCSLPSLVFFLFLAKHRGGRFLFSYCLADTICLELLHITGILDLFLGNTYLFTILSRALLCPLMAFFLVKYVRNMYLYVQRHVAKGWYTFSFISLIFYLTLSLSMSSPAEILQQPKALAIHLLLLLLMPCLYIHIFTTLHHLQNETEIETKEHILEVQVSNMTQRIEEFISADKKHRMERHDFRHKMQAIAGLIDKEKYTELKALVEEYSDAMKEVRIKNYCDHPVLDAVLGSYLQKAENLDIRITTRIHFPDELPFREAELATVFANALENAIHGCETLPPEKRFLEITVLTEPCFMFQIRNSFDGLVAYDRDGIPLSSRKGHGYGTRSIVTFCENNRGLYEFKSDEHTFALRISFH